jgi:hypothetical protein
MENKMKNFINSYLKTIYESVENTLKFEIAGKTSEGEEVKEVIEAPSQLAAEIQFKEKYGEDVEIKFETLIK